MAKESVGIFLEAGGVLIWWWNGYSQSALVLFAVSVGRLRFGAYRLGGVAVTTWVLLLFVSWTWRPGQLL